MLPAGDLEEIVELENLFRVIGHAEVRAQAARLAALAVQPVARADLRRAVQRASSRPITLLAVPEARRCSALAAQAER